MRNTVSLIKLHTPKNLFPELPRYTFKNPNPQIPKLYGLPKIHKEGKKFRPIVSNIASPTEKLSKWLVSEFNQYNEPMSFSTKNSYDFIDKIKDVQLDPTEVLISFDVTSLFPSVPMEYTLDLLEIWLEQEGVSKEKIHSYRCLTEHCIKENYLLFDGLYYKQLDGLAMGNALSPFLANLFMAHLETDLTQHQIFPRVWWRYVDDVFSVVKIDKISEVLNLINSQHQSIKFTYELESNQKLPFLDLMIIRNQEKIEFDIYRKSTNTTNYIPNDSSHNVQHKSAAFICMIYRLLLVPLND